jgi:hypothetical protein
VSKVGELGGELDVVVAAPVEEGYCVCMGAVGLMVMKRMSMVAVAAIFVSGVEVGVS